MATWEPMEQDITTYTEDTDWVWLMRMAYKYWICRSTRDDKNEYVLPEEMRIEYFVTYNSWEREESQIFYIVLRR